MPVLPIVKMLRVAPLPLRGTSILTTAPRRQRLPLSVRAISGGCYRDGESVSVSRAASRAAISGSGCKGSAAGLCSRGSFGCQLPPILILLNRVL